MKKILAILFVGGLALIVAVAVALFYLGPLIKKGVETVGPQITKVPVDLKSAHISVLSGKGELSGFTLGNPEGFKTPEALKVGTVAINLEPRSVMDKKVIVHSVRIENPEITYEAGLGGSNIGKILDNLQSIASQEKSASTNTANKTLQVDEFVITGAKLNVSATMLGGHSATLPLPEIRLTGLGQSPEGITPAELSAKAFGAVVEAAVKAVTSSTLDLSKIGGGAVESLGNAAKDTVKKLGTGMSDLFKPKKE